jgi:transcription antitermination factor NusG
MNWKKIVIGGRLELIIAFTFFTIFEPIMEKESRWYVFYVRSRAEKSAVGILQDLGFEAYVPLMTVHRVWSDRIKKVVVPMFSGYVFVRCNKFEITKVLQQNHIVAALKTGIDYSVIRDSEIEMLRKIEAGNYSVLVEPGTISINLGDDVEIIAGTMKGYIGKCVEESASKYFVVVLDGINQSIKVKIGMEFLRKLPSRQLAAGAKD